MARSPRIDYPGAWHHVMNRGADHQCVFRTDDDRNAFLRLVGVAASRYDMEVHAFCLLDNHYHLLLRSAAARLSDMMQYVGGTYSARFNRIHGRDGALFRGRFRSVLVDKDPYLVGLSRYIHRNPIGARLATAGDLRAYRWSSYPIYAGDRDRHGWLRQRDVLEAHGSRASYVTFVEGNDIDSTIEEFYARSEPPSILGDDAFVSQLDVTDDPLISPTRSSLRRIDLSTIDSAICDVAEVGEDALCESKRGQPNLPRMLAVSLGQSMGHASLRELAERYGYNTISSASTAIHRASRETSSNGVGRALEAAVRSRLVNP